MPAAKPWDPEDVAIYEILADLVADSGLTVRGLVSATGMKQSRVHSLLTGTSAPATVGEIERMAAAVGHRGSTLVRWAEERVAADETPEEGRVVEFGRGRRPELPAHVPDRVAALHSEVSHHDADVEREELP
jgi:hypothetical protein